MKHSFMKTLHQHDRSQKDWCSKLYQLIGLAGLSFQGLTFLLDKDGNIACRSRLLVRKENSCSFTPTKPI